MNWRRRVYHWTDGARDLVRTALGIINKEHMAPSEQAWRGEDEVYVNDEHILVVVRPDGSIRWGTGEMRGYEYTLDDLIKHHERIGQIIDAAEKVRPDCNCKSVQITLRMDSDTLHHLTADPNLCRVP